MKNYTKNSLLIGSFLLLFCAFPVISQEVSSSEILDPPTNASVKVHEDARIKKVLDVRSKMNFDDRFKIQLYYGNLKEANKLLAKYKEAYDEWPSTIAYETPNHKVWVGNFRNRLEADRALLSIRKKFPSAFVFKP